MELYYKDLISEEDALGELVDNLSLVVQGAEEFAQAAGAQLHPDSRRDLQSRVERLKDGCRRVREHAKGGAIATDKMLRRNPYLFAGVAFALGVLAGALLCHSMLTRNQQKDGGGVGNHSID